MHIIKHNQNMIKRDILKDLTRFVYATLDIVQESDN